MRFLNSFIVPKYMERETLWDFWHFSLLQNILKKLESGTLWRRKNFEKELHSSKKNCSKKFLAEARTQIRDRWVHRKPSKDCTYEYMWTSEVCKKWYIDDEVCCLTKKKLVTVIVGLFSLEKRRLKRVKTALARFLSRLRKILLWSSREKQCQDEGDK